MALWIKLGGGICTLWPHQWTDPRWKECVLSFSFCVVFLKISYQVFCPSNNISQWKLGVDLSISWAIWELYLNISYQISFAFNNLHYDQWEKVSIHLFYLEHAYTTQLILYLNWFPKNKTSRGFENLTLVFGAKPCTFMEREVPKLLNEFEDKFQNP